MELHLIHVLLQNYKQDGVPLKIIGVPFNNAQASIPCKLSSWMVIIKVSKNIEKLVQGNSKVFKKLTHLLTPKKLLHYQNKP